MDAWPKGSPTAPPSRGTAVRRRGGSFGPMEADERSAPGPGEREEDGEVAEAGGPSTQTRCMLFIKDGSCHAHVAHISTRWHDTHFQ